MKKVFTTLFAMFGMAMAMNAATEADIKPMMHSYVLVCDNITANGTAKTVKGSLVGANYFYCVTGNSNSTSKGSIDIADPSTYTTTYGGAEEDTLRLSQKYTSYGLHYNSMRLKNAQDVIAFKPTAGSVVYVFGSGNNKAGASARIPKFATDAALTDALNEAPTDDYPSSSNYCYKFVVPAQFDGNTPLYVGSYNGDAFFSFIVVEANEPAGTPSVETGVTMYDETEKLYYQEVTCTPNDYILDGDNMGATKVYYTTDGTEPTEASAEYTAPIKCYKDMTVKFQAYWEGIKCEGANNEATVEFVFNAPTLTVDGATATISTEYQNATNYYSFNDVPFIAGDSYTATVSGSLSAYTEIKNGDHATWTTGTATSPIYVLDPIKEKKVLTITGTSAIDEEATAANTNLDENGNPLPIYMAVDAKLLVNGQESDPCIYLVPDATFSVIKADTAQIDGKEVYLQMNKDNLTFLVAEGDSVDVTVVVSKNSHKNATDLQTKVNVNGTVYGNENILTDGNIITFSLGAGIQTFKKFSGTGNIHVASIEITPRVGADGIKGVQAAGVQTELDLNAPIYDLTGRQVSNPVKGIYLQNGKKFIVK